MSFKLRTNPDPSELLAIEFMSKRMLEARDNFKRYDQEAKDAAEKSANSKREMDQWREAILMVDPEYFKRASAATFSIGAVKVEPKDDGPAKGAKTVPYGYWTGMGEKILNAFTSGTFEQLVTKSLEAGLTDGRDREGMEPMRYALHGLARRGKTVKYENGVFYKI
ncbi:MAG: hypothetical protein IPJ76_17805 [Flavobacteriales bacterium]|nr:MAG: hypothetical protein IPJ76_17805 [Flavobacteriales bacterium]